MDKNILIISDTHIPFEHKDYLSFCKRIYSAFKCQRVVHIGDLVDNHAISYHEHDPDGWSPEQEMEQADKHLKPWYRAFPNVYLCRGNHDRLVDRKGKTVGLPKRCFKTFREMWKLPKGWVDDFSFTFDNVCYQHSGSGGKYGHVTTAYNNRMSTVIGHLHSVSGVEYIANEKEVIFGMCVGCGLDRKKYAFDYGRQFLRKPILSCGLVSVTKYGTNATVIPMRMK